MLLSSLSRILLLVCVCAVAFPAPVRAQQVPGKVVLAAGGKAAAVIVLPDAEKDNPDKATPVLVEQSGKILAEFLKRMTGAEFKTVRCAELGQVEVQGDKVTSAALPADNYILVGQSELTKRLGISPTLEPGSTYMKAAGNVVTFLGPSDGTLYTGGVRYAVQQFLESQGVRYLWPGELGLVVPARKDIAVPYGVQTFSPPVKQRGIRVVLGQTGRWRGHGTLGLTRTTPRSWWKLDH